MKRLLLLTAIFLGGCSDAKIELNTKSPERTPTETISVYVDSFNSADGFRNINGSYELLKIWRR